MGGARRGGGDSDDDDLELTAPTLAATATLSSTGSPAMKGGGSGDERGKVGIGEADAAEDVPAISSGDVVGDVIV